MATMSLDRWLNEVVFPQTDLNRDLWGKLSQPEQNQILGSFNTNIPGLSDPTKIDQAMATGSFQTYDPPKEGGMFSMDSGIGPFLLLASLGYGAAGAGGMFGAEGAVSGGLEGALGGEALGSAGFGTGTGGLQSIAQTATDWAQPDILGEQYARAPQPSMYNRSLTGSFPYPTSGADQGALDLLKQVQDGTYLPDPGNYAPVETLPRTLTAEGYAGLPGAGGTPYGGSPLSGGTGDAWPGTNQFAGPAGEVPNLMPPADPSGMNPNMLETGTPSWNPNYVPSSGGGGIFDVLRNLAQPGVPLNIGDTPYPGTQEGGGAPQTGGGTSGALARIIAGTATTADWLSVGGTAGATGLGLIGANAQSDAMTKLASQFAEYGAPYRAQLASISQDPNQFYNSPTGQGALNAVLQKLSVGGNPAGDPYKQALATSSLYDKYSQERGLLGTLGGLSAYNAAAPGMAGTAAGTQSKIYDVLGYGLNQATQPKNDMLSLLKSMGMTTSAA